MPTLYEIYKDIRYKARYIEIDYRQRYYSTDKNPRVIQTRLPNQKLLSLRTWPHDKYFIKPGEFLTVNYGSDTDGGNTRDDGQIEKLNQSWVNIGSKNYNQYLRCGLLEQKSLDDTAIIDAKRGFDEDQVPHAIRRVKSTADLLSTRDLLAANEDDALHGTCCSHCPQKKKADVELKSSKAEHILSASSFTSSFSLMSPSLLPMISSPKAKRFKDRVRSTFGKGNRDSAIVAEHASSNSNGNVSSSLEGSSPSNLDASNLASSEDVSPLTPAGRTATPRPPSTPESQPHLFNIPGCEPSPSKMGISRQGRYINRPSRVQSIVSRLSVSSSMKSDSTIPNPHSMRECECIKCSTDRAGYRKDGSANENHDSKAVPQPWSKVFNDVSLEAARICTGSTPRSRADLGNLTSDFTESKTNLDKLTAVNANSRSYIKYYSNQEKENLKSIMTTTLKSKINVGTSMPTTYTAGFGAMGIDSPDSYSNEDTEGILSMYDY